MIGSDRLLQILSAPLKEFIPDEKTIEEVFDRFEYMLALTYLGINPARGYGPLGRFAWRAMYGSSVLADVEAEAKKAGTSWPPIKAGLYGGSINAFEKARAAYTSTFASVGW